MLYDTMVKIKFKTRFLCAQLLKADQNYTISSKYSNVGKIMFLLIKSTYNIFNVRSLNDVNLRKYVCRFRF